MKSFAPKVFFILLNSIKTCLKEIFHSKHTDWESSTRFKSQYNEENSFKNLKQILRIGSSNVFILQKPGSWSTGQTSTSPAPFSSLSGWRKVEWSLNLSCSGKIWMGGGGGGGGGWLATAIALACWHLAIACQYML